tara:strand:+ start:9 stop:716 length:708 start_codon:yes stop_codon:yes gene_type:complete
MYKKNKILSIITARGGSKGLPGKNVIKILGKPLISWTINHALNSKYIDRLIVSTDDKKIANVSKKYGADVPFMRPSHLAEDESSSIDVVLHAIDWLENNNEFYDYIILLEPTSPLRETSDIDNSLEKLINTDNAESIVSVCKPESSHPDFIISLENGFIKKYYGKGFSHKRRQDLDDVFYYEGTFYTSKVSTLKSKKSFYHKNTLGYEVPRWKSFEVDEEIDLKIIESILKFKKI